MSLALRRSRLEDATTIQQQRDDYLHTLIAPLDGMWEGAVIARAAFWELHDGAQAAGHYCLRADNALLRFQVAEGYQAQAETLLRWVIAEHAITQAIASTSEPPYFALCLDVQRGVAVHSYLFHDHGRHEFATEQSRYVFKMADQGDLADFVRFYQASLDGTGAWIATFLQERIDHAELFVMHDAQTMVATGECIPSQRQPPYADLGMVVGRAYRGQGLATAMLMCLKQRCYALGWTPICACAAANLASKRAIEKAGFISTHRIVQFDIPPSHI